MQHAPPPHQETQRPTPGRSDLPNPPTAPATETRRPATHHGSQQRTPCNNLHGRPWPQYDPTQIPWNLALDSYRSRNQSIFNLGRSTFYNSSPRRPPPLPPAPTHPQPKQPATSVRKPEFPTGPPPTQLHTALQAERLTVAPITTALPPTTSQQLQEPPATDAGQQEAEEANTPPIPTTPSEQSCRRPSRPSNYNTNSS